MLNKFQITFVQFPIAHVFLFEKKTCICFLTILNNAVMKNVFFNFQLIFSEDFVRAMETEHHSNHFACKQCEKSLTGHRYILKEDQPYCLQCYEQVFANVCEECNEKIGCDSKVRNGSLIIWSFFSVFSIISWLYFWRVQLLSADLCTFSWLPDRTFQRSLSLPLSHTPPSHSSST